MNMQNLKAKISKSHTHNKKDAKNPKNSFKKYILPWVIIMGFLIILPIFIMILYSFIETGVGGLVFTFSFSNFAQFFGSSELMISLWTSIGIALASALICLIIAFPMAYVMAGLSKKNTKLAYITLITMPIWINMLLKIIALKMVFEVLFPNLNTDYTWWPVIVALVYTYLPFMVLPLYVSLEKRDKTIEEASLDLGASKIQTFVKITLPNQTSAITSGIVLVFLPAITTLAATRIMSEGTILGIGNVIESIFLDSGNFTYGAAISVVVMVLMFLILAIIKLPEKKLLRKGGKNIEK